MVLVIVTLRSFTDLNSFYWSSLLLLKRNCFISSLLWVNYYTHILKRLVVNYYSPITN
jgi:hypothetical protein